MRHRVADDDQDGKEHGAQNRNQDGADIAHLLHEPLRECPFRFGLRLVRGIGKFIVNGVRCRDCVLRVAHFNRVPANHPFAQGAGLVKIIVAKVKPRGVRALLRSVEDTHDLIHELYPAP